MYKPAEKTKDKIRKAVTYLQAYIAAYDKQVHYEKYSEETLIDDVLYALGAALDPSYKYANGYERFKERLMIHLTS